ncbi:MAG: metallophosphoesterase [Xanthomonadales bacterium]
MNRAILTAIAAIALLAGCAAPEPRAEAPQAGAFQHDVDAGVRPWTHERFDNAPGKFTFALFSDLTGGERAGVFDVAVAQLRLLRPELIVNVGDLIEGGTTDRAQLTREWDAFDRRARQAHAPVFYLGGNHDLSNPAMWAVWDERYGRRHYHFRYRDVLFLVLNTEDNPPEFQWHADEIRNAAIERIDAEGWGVLPETAYGQLEERRTGRVGAAQADYFRDVIARNPDVLHTFVLLHKPAWERPDEENFARIEAALADRPYTVFYGHEHDYQHEVRHGRDYIGLGTTGGVQSASKAMSVDHVTLVTVTPDGVDIANLKLSGIFGKDGRIPAGGEALCFEARRCAEQPAPQH